jgi:cyanate permease
MSFLGGLCLGPVLFGWVVDMSGSYTVAWSGAVCAFFLAAVIAARARS